MQKTIIIKPSNQNNMEGYLHKTERDLNINGIRQFLKGSSAYVGKNKYKFKYS